VGALYRHDSPYTYFSSGDLHLGEISLECSRAGASAVALWATQRMLPLVRGGEFSRDLDRCLEAARKLHRRMEGDDRFRVMFSPELDIVVWTVRGMSSRSVFEACARKNLHLAVAKLGGEECLRSCLMKPEHLDWIDRIWKILAEST
jgi:glutamate/tyrosine decarboxylase-like PLP-dependent enzyme